MLTVLADEPSIVTQYLRQLRDVELQQDSRLFERNLERIGMLGAYEVSKHLAYTDHQTTTPLGVSNTPLLKDDIIITTILRAGLPVQRGVQQVFDDARLSFIAAGRKPETPAGVEIDLAYVATPKLDNAILIIADTMIATGQSIIDSYNALISGWGTPLQTYVVGVIASQAGIKKLQAAIPGINIVVGAVDPELNDKFFIVPGLGDAGDLLYGPKDAHQ